VHKSDYIRSILIGMLVGVVLGATFVAGFFFHATFAPTVATNRFPDQPGYPLLDEVQGLLDHVFLREQPAYNTRQYAAIRGMLTTLNEPNTFFIDPPVAQSESDALAGTYGGIGVLLRRNEAGEFVLTPFPDSPAAIAGIIDGAVLLEVNGTRLELDTHPDAVDQMLRGEVDDDNGVNLVIRQIDTEQNLFVEFAVINVPSVIWRISELDSRIGYIQILKFTARTPNELDTALRDLIELNIESLVLDLRNNGGGLLEEAVSVASQFLDGGTVIFEVSRDSERVLEGEPGGLAIDLPLVVLVNGKTASASELVAGAIRDRDRGILIGQNTFGKGTVQQIFPLSDGSSIHITSAEWFTPLRVPLAGVGLQPDIAMIPDENGRDVELGEAIRVLQRQLTEIESEKQ